MSNARVADAGASPRSRRYRRCAAALAIMSLMLLSTAAHKGATKDAPRAAASSHAHVYLMRGLLNIFSLGMDQLAAQIARRGIEASVHNHTEADRIASEIAARYRAGDHGPIILIGHSLGADAVMQMAQALNREAIPVALVIPFDGTGSYAAPKNVACVLNLTQREYAYMHSGAGFHGKLSNVNVSGSAGIDHFTIDKSPRLQAQALHSVLQAARSETCRPGFERSTAAKPAEPASPHAAPPLRPGIEG